jgi:MOSC domain-containing protein YiiM
VQLVSVNVGRPRDVVWRGRPVRTGIFKEPVSGRVRLRGVNLEGDAQADLLVHGGHDKAVYAYPSEHYAFWRAELDLAELSHGAFGENLTTEGLAEDAICIGDRLRAGSAELVVTQPRIPCFKLGLRLGRADAVKRFAESGRSGFYLSVAREGELGAGDPLELVARDEDSLTVAQLLDVYYGGDDRALLARAAALPGLAASWREELDRRLARDPWASWSWPPTDRGDPSA